MPTYNYKCESCGTFEHFQKMSEDRLSSCPHCGESVKKVFVAPSIIGMPNGPKSTVPAYNANRSPLWNSAQAE